MKEQSHLILRIIWGLGFLACFSACMYYVIIAIQQYFQVVSIEDIPASFPMISFCNMKPVAFGSPTVESYLLTNVFDFLSAKKFILVIIRMVSSMSLFIKNPNQSRSS